MIRHLIPALLLFLHAAAAAQEAPLAIVHGRPHDVIAQCLMWQMPPNLRAFPRVHPPPSEEAEVHMYVRGHDQAEDPVGIFYIRPSGAGALGITFAQVSGIRGEYDRVARIAAQRCAR